MKPLVKLFWQKRWGQIRNLFAKPLTAVVTLLCVGFFAFGFVPLITNIGHDALDAAGFALIEFYLLGMLLMMFMSMFLAKRKSLFFLSDSYYLFTGPFTNRQVLTCLLMDCVVGALMLGVLSVFVAASIGVGYITPVYIILNLLLAGLLVGYSLTVVLDVLYVRQMVTEGKGGRSFQIAVGAIVALVAGLYGYYIVANGFDFGAAWKGFSTGALFYAVPVFGWAKLALDGVFLGSLVYTAAGYGLLVLLGCVLPSLVLVNTKGFFFEQAMLDAEKFTEYYAKAKQGKADEVLRSVRTAEVHFKGGIWAILSKNWLLAKKQRFFRVQDLIVLVAYVAMAVLFGFGFLGLCMMLLIWLFIATSVPSLVEDLKHHYIYLIPGNPVKKLFASLLVPLGKNCVLLVVSVFVGGLLLGEGIVSVAMVAGIGLTFCLLLTMANVLSLNIMKSRNNMMVEQVMRLLVVMVAAVPSIVLLILLLGVMEVGLGTVLAVMGGCNLLMSGILLAICAPMINGRELSAD